MILIISIKFVQKIRIQIRKSLKVWKHIHNSFDKSDWFLKIKLCLHSKKEQVGILSVKKYNFSSCA